MRMPSLHAKTVYVRLPCQSPHSCHSDACVSALDLQLCSTDGHASGAVAASAPPAGTCTSSASCTSAQSCDTSQCTKLTKVCGGLDA